MSVIPANPLTNTHYLLAQPTKIPTVPTPQTAPAPAADKDGDSDKGGVDIKA